jgi:hypothetical protein
MDASENSSRRYLASLLILGKVTTAERALDDFERTGSISREGNEFYRSIIAAARACGMHEPAEAGTVGTCVKQAA